MRSMCGLFLDTFSFESKLTKKISTENKKANTSKVSILLIIEEDEYEKGIIKNN